MSHNGLIQHFSLSVAMATNQNEESAQNFYAWWRTKLLTFLKTFCPNTCNETAIKANFHFPIISLWKLKLP